MKVAWISLGCPKNQVDSERMLALLQGAGMELVAAPEEAEVAVVNTCGFHRTGQAGGHRSDFGTGGTEKGRRAARHCGGRLSEPALWRGVCRRAARGGRGAGYRQLHGYCSGGGVRRPGGAVFLLRRAGRLSPGRTADFDHAALYRLPQNCRGVRQPAVRTASSPPSAAGIAAGPWRRFWRRRRSWPPAACGK